MEEKVKCKYIFKDNYNPKYVNGAFGGLSPRGEIIINFYFERNAIPNSQTYTIKENSIAEEIVEEREPKDHFNSKVRVIENGIVLDYKNAKEIHRWLGEQIEVIENLNENE